MVLRLKTALKGKVIKLSGTNIEGNFKIEVNYRNKSNNRNLN